MQISLGRAAFLFALLLAAPVWGDGPFAGKYSDGKLTVDLADSGGAYAGTFTLGSQQFAASAHSSGQGQGGPGLDGSFTSGGNSFPFTASLDADTLTLITGGKTYALKRLSPAGNPLAAQADNPLAQAGSAAGAAGGNDGPAGYTVVSSTDSGKSLVTQKAGITSVQAALEATLPELRRYFAVKPTIGRAYESNTDHKSGGATFTAALNGQPVRGIVSCKLNDKGATVAVIYCRSDASKAEWDKLIHPAGEAPAAGAAPGAAAGDGGSAPAAAAGAAAAGAAPDPAQVLGPDAQVYQYADGTGSLTLAQGWTTNAQSALDATFIKGPASQAVFMNAALAIQTKDSPLMKMIAQNQARAKQMGMKPAPGPSMLVADFTDPVQAMMDLNPQISKTSASKGGPSQRIDKIVMHQDMPCKIPNGKAAVIQCLLTRTLNGKSTQYEGVQTTIMYSLGAPGSGGPWMYVNTGCTAPVGTFDHDKPIMLAMINSLRLNQQMFAQRSQERNQQQMAMIKQMGDASEAALQANHAAWQQQQDQRNATWQEQHQEQLDGYAQHNAQFNAYELQRSRSKDDFVETIQGTRTVYDTQTGASSKVDLTSAGGIVDQMNADALDPGRFVQIPLRDEQDPEPAGK